MFFTKRIKHRITNRLIISIIWNKLLLAIDKMYLNKSFYDFVTARSVRAFGCMSVKFLLKRVSVYYCLVKLELLGAFNPLSTNPTKWPNTLKQFVDNLPTNCLSVWPFCGIGA